MRPIFALLLLAACHDADKTGPSPISSTASTAAPVSSAPIHGLGTGQLAILEPRWGFAAADANGDGTDDVIALTKVTNDGDAERRLVAFDGKTRAVLWRSDALRPWEREANLTRAMVLVGGGNVAVMRRWTTVDFYDLGSGAKKQTLTLDGRPGAFSCPDPSAPNRWYLELSEGDELSNHPIPVNAYLDIGTMKSTPAPERPAFCASHWGVIDSDPLHACLFLHTGERALAQCAPSALAPQTPFKIGFVVTTPEVALAVGKDDALVRFDAKAKKLLWTQKIPDADELRGIDVTTAGILLAVITPKAHRVVMLDTNTGAIRFDRKVEGDIEDPRVVGARLYVPTTAPYQGAGYEPHGRVDVFDAYTGTPLFSLGGEEGLR